MTRITQISRLHNCGIFRNFTWPSDLPNFGRYNLIYGWNGTGKTTLSCLFRNLELRETPKTGAVSLDIDGRVVNGGDFPQSNLQVRVFNRDFIRQNVFPVGYGNLPLILVLGKKSVEKQKKIEAKKKQRETTESELKSAENASDSAKQKFDDFCKNRARVIKDELRSNYKHSYTYYDKSKYWSDACALLKSGTRIDCHLSQSKQDDLRSQLTATLKPKLTEIDYVMPDFNLIENDVSNLLSTSVTSVVIDALKSDSVLVKWLREGLALHKDRKLSQCQFCEQPLPKERFDALETYFNEEYKKFIQRIDLRICKIQEKLSKLEQLKLPNKVELYDDFHQEFQTLELKLNDSINLVRKYFETVESPFEGQEE